MGLKKLEVCGYSPGKYLRAVTVRSRGNAYIE